MEKQQSPDPLFTLRGDMDAIHSVTFQSRPGSEHLLASTQSGTIHKWNLQTCREDFRFQVSMESCLAIRCIDNIFISQTKDGKITFWEEGNNSWKLKAEVITGYWGFCKFDGCNDKFLVCPEADAKVRIVGLDGKLISTFCIKDEKKETDEKSGELMAIKCFSRSGTDYIFALCENGLLTLFRAFGGKVSDLKLTSDSSECPMALDFDRESAGVVGGSGDVIVGFQLTEDLRLVRGRQVTITNHGVSCLAIRPDKKLFAAGCWDSRLRLFSMKSFKLLVVLQNHKEVIQDICYSTMRVESWSTQWLLAAASKDGRITLWDLYS